MNNDPLREWLKLDIFSKKSESPIEAMLFNALTYVISAGYFQASEVGSFRHPVHLGQQVVEGDYRIDITLCAPHIGLRVAIECDGHAFHERTPEQAERDKRKDRALTSAGWMVIRFTGREIYRDPFACAYDAINAAWQNHQARSA